MSCAGDPIGVLIGLLRLLGVLFPRVQTVPIDDLPSPPPLGPETAMTGIGKTVTVRVTVLVCPAVSV
jgi:hypothetical protein